MELENFLDAIADNGLAHMLDDLRRNNKIGKESAYQAGDTTYLYSFETVIGGEPQQIQVLENKANKRFLITGLRMQAGRALEYNDDTATMEQIEEKSAPEYRRNEKGVFYIGREDVDSGETVSDCLKDCDFLDYGNPTTPRNYRDVAHLLIRGNPMKENIEEFLPYAEPLAIAPRDGSRAPEGRSR